MIKDSKKTFGELDPTLQLEIKKLELKAEMPQGVIDYYLSAKPDTEVLATVNGNDAAGNDITTFIYKDENGMPGVVEVVATGGIAKPSAKETDEAQKLLDFETAKKFIADNPDATYADLLSGIQQYTTLNDSEIKTLMNQAHVVEKETPMSDAQMKTTLAYYILTFGLSSAKAAITAGNIWDYNLSRTQINKMIRYLDDATIQKIISDPTKYFVETDDKGNPTKIRQKRTGWFDKTIYEFK
jgi:hypothetical protein